MHNHDSGFEAVDKRRDSQEMGVEDFVIDPEAVILSPDEAWVIKHFLSAVADESLYSGLRDHIRQYYVGGAYETASVVPVPREFDLPLAGAYVGIFWQLKDTDPEGAQVVREKVEVLYEDKSEDVKKYFRQQLLGPIEDNPQN